MIEITDWELSMGKQPKFNNIILKNPTVQEVYDFGESNYSKIVSLFTTTPYKVRYELYEMGIDFSTMSDFDLFINLITSGGYDKSLKWFCGYSNFKIIMNEKVLKYEVIGEKITEKNDNEIKEIFVINEVTYNMLKIYIKRLNYIPDEKRIKWADKENAGELDKYYIKQTLKTYKRNKELDIKKNKNKSLIGNVLTATTVGTSKSYNELLNMSIFEMWKSFYGMNKKSNYDLQMSAAYAGTIELNESKIKQIDWINN